MRRLLEILAASVLGLLAFAAGAAEKSSIAGLLAPIVAVRGEGQGNEQATAAWKQLVQKGPEVLPDILAAMNDDHPLAANWLRTAVDAIAEKALRGGQRLPAAALEKFIADTRHARIARRLAYEWLAQADPATPGRLLPGMLKDPSPELRRDAVALAIKDAEAILAKGDRDAAKAAFQKALSGACDQDQVDALAKRLKELGAEVNLGAHFGVIKTWHLVVPFDNTNDAGFKVLYPPEARVDLKAIYKGKGDAEARWKENTTADPYGIVDLNKVLGKQKAVVAYAFAAIDSPAERTVQIRVGCITAVKVFLNGKEVFAKEEYHHGMRFDQYVATATLKAGRNELLLKVCQNNQSESWAQDWKFQARLTDPAGSPVPWTVAVGHAPHAAERKP